MSIANALSGLTVTARGTEVIASNLANALTPGYARRELELSPRITAGNGGGVQVGSINRIVSATVLSEFRTANAEVARSAVTLDFYKSLEAKIGLPSEGGSLSAMLSDLDASLISAASRPDSEIRLRAVFEAADQLVKKIRTVSTAIQDSRTEADRQIGLKVESLNNDLAEIARLNRQIIVEQANGRDASSLADARQVVIDRISLTIPVREVPRDNGRIALFSSGGAVLIDGSDPTRLDFNLSGRMTPEVDESSTQIGSLMLDGVKATPAQMDLLSGGPLLELFKLRDEYGVAAQASVDAIARELHDRFANPTIDPSIVPGGLACLRMRMGALIQRENEDWRLVL
ncbi:MAG: FlgK family flagellar hook-associated protein [Paracoccus sp. (in: a-proteobacteria)]